MNENKISNLWSDTLIVIVLYNISLTDSLSFISLNRARDCFNSSDSIDVLICDNSLYIQNISNLQGKHETFNLMYLHDSSNPGVSLSYNRAAELANIHKKKWLLVLDQDTTLPFDIFSKYHKTVIDFPDFPIYAPKIYCNGILYSPCRYIFRKGSNFLNIDSGVQLMKYKNVLNSGLLIQLDAFYLAGGYDERVELYFSDFVFFNRLKQHFKKFVIIDCHLDHQLSSVDYSDLENALKRFIYYCKGAMSSSRNSFLAYINQIVIIGVRSLLLSYRFKSYKFLVEYFRVFFNCV